MIEGIVRSIVSLCRSPVMVEGSVSANEISRRYDTVLSKVIRECGSIGWVGYKVWSFILTREGMSDIPESYLQELYKIHVDVLYISDILPSCNISNKVGVYKASIKDLL